MFLHAGTPTVGPPFGFGFGRDESGSPFVFTQAQVDTSIECWSHVMRAEGWRAKTKPTPESIHALELCISDVNSAPIMLS